MSYQYNQRIVLEQLINLSNDRHNSELTNTISDEQVIEILEYANKLRLFTTRSRRLGKFIGLVIISIIIPKKIIPSPLFSKN